MSVLSSPIRRCLKHLSFELGPEEHGDVIMLTDYHAAMDHPWLTTDGAGGVRVKVKVVPGASRDRIVGELGDRLKVGVSAPPEGGKANNAVCALIAGVLGLSRRDVSVLDGHSRPQKTVGVMSVSVEQAWAALSAAFDRA